MAFVVNCVHFSCLRRNEEISTNLLRKVNGTFKITGHELDKSRPFYAGHYNTSAGASIPYEYGTEPSVSGALFPQAILVLQHDLGTSGQYEHMSCDEAVAKLFYYRPVPSADNGTIGGTNTTTSSGILSTNAPAASGGAPASTNGTIDFVPVVSIPEYWTFTAPTHSEPEVRRFISSVDDLNADLSTGSMMVFTTHSDTEIALHLGGYYQLCWQLTTGRWRNVVENITVQGPYAYNLTNQPLLGHPFEIGFDVLSLSPTGVENGNDPAFAATNLLVQNIQLEFCDMFQDPEVGAPGGVGILGRAGAKIP